MSLEETHITTERDDRVLRVTFNRPAKKNSITQAMYRALTAALNDASGDDTIRAVYLTGSEDSFSAGNDLLDFQNAQNLSADNPIMAFLHTLISFEKPLIVGVNGIAVGIGLTMLLHSDIVLIAKGAVLSAPFVDLALVPEAASSLLLPGLVGRAMATDIVMAGRRLSAEEAVDLGLGSRLVEPGELEAEGLKAAHAIAAKAPNAVKFTKQLMRPDVDMLKGRMEQEVAHFSAQLASPEVFEAISAFLQRRPPTFG